MRKRIFAVFLLIICLMSFVVTSFAAVSYQTALYTTSYQSTDRNEGVNTRSTYYDYYSRSGGTVYYFELTNTSDAGTLFVPDSVNWPLAYYAYDSTTSQGYSPTYRFYLPTFWNFQIRTTAANNLVFDSTFATFHQDPTNPDRGYYEISLGNFVDFADGWYIYSLEVAHPPIIRDTVNVTYRYFDYDNNNALIDTIVVAERYSDLLVTLYAPSLTDYIFYNGSNKFIFSSLTSPITIDVYVRSLSIVLQAEYQSGLSDGLRQGYNNGVRDGRIQFINSAEYQNLLDDAFDEGYAAAVRDGSADGYPPIINPLRFVTQPVVQFLRIQVYPGLQLGVLFLAAIGVSLLIVFLKIFAGG